MLPNFPPLSSVLSRKLHVSCVFHCHNVLLFIVTDSGKQCHDNMITKSIEVTESMMLWRYPSMSNKPTQTLSTVCTSHNFTTLLLALCLLMSWASKNVYIPHYDSIVIMHLLLSRGHVYEYGIYYVYEYGISYKFTKYTTVIHVCT